MGALEPDAMSEGSFTHAYISNTNTFLKHMIKLALGSPHYKVWPRAFAWYREMDSAGEALYREGFPEVLTVN